MEDVTIRTIEEMLPYDGPHRIEGIEFRYAGRDLGVSAWGMNVLVLAAGASRYPEHDHGHDGQEEVYAVLRGSAELVCGDRRYALPTGAFARVAAHVKRKLVPGPDGVTVLAIGATPGKAYERPPELG